MKHGIEGFPTLDKVSSIFSLQSSLSWFDMVLAALDCYTWVFGENLLTPADLFGSMYHFSLTLHAQFSNEADDKFCYIYLYFRGRSRISRNGVHMYKGMGGSLS